MPRSLAIPDEVQRAIRERLTEALAHAAGAFESAVEDEDTLTGDLCGALRTPQRRVADLYRTKVEQLAAALQREDSRLEASETLRGLIDSIVLMPEKGQPPSRLARTRASAGQGSGSSYEAIWPRC